MVQSFGSHFVRCASLPKASIIQDAMLWIEMNADTVGCRLAHHIDREMLLLIPADRMRRDLFRGEIPRHIANRNLVLVESELHLVPAPVLSDHAHAQFIVGIENSAPSLTPEGQRAVTVLVLV